MDNDVLMAMLGDISEKLSTIVDLLVRVQSSTSSIESDVGSIKFDTDDIGSIRSELEDINNTVEIIADK
ncbi:MAG: hypothetical protein GX379_07005 [Clostridiales bacterium]|jgi:hypothetical protein|nr:hypothetical protein [Clostridiales bacterium]